MTAEVEFIPGPKTDHTVQNFISRNEIKQRHKTALTTAEAEFVPGPKTDHTVSRKGPEMWAHFSVNNAMILRSASRAF